MNDFDPTLDEIVSAYVDGEATAAERAQVEADPALLERVATFRRLHDAVATTAVPASAEARRALIARALRDMAPPAAMVHPLRARRFAAAARPLAVAAAIIAAFIGFAALVANNDNGEDSETFASSGAAITKRDQFAPPPAGAGDSAAMEAAQTPTTAASSASGAPLAAVSPPPFLGSFTDEAALRRALVEQTAKTAPAQTQGSARTTSDAAACPEIAGSAPSDATVYRAELRGKPVTIMVSGTSVVMYDDTTCARTVFDLTSR